MANKVGIGLCVLLVCVTGVSGLQRQARADGEPTAMAGGPAFYLAAGALAINAGATIANGVALAAGKPDRGRGMFGVVLGGASIAAAAATFAFADENSDPKGFSIALAGCGLASLLTGYLNVRGAEGGPSAVGQKTGDLCPRVVFGQWSPGVNRCWVAAIQVGF